MRPRLLRTAAFRLALVYAGLFTAGAVLLAGGFDWSVSSYARNRLRDDVADELRLLLRSTDGRAAEVAQRVRLREQALGARQFRYLVLDPAGRVLTSDLPVSAAGADPKAALLTRAARLPDGGRLVVGRSSHGLHRLLRTMTTAALWTAAISSVMSLAIAFLIAGVFLARIERVNAAVSSIMDGRMDDRLPAIGMGDEFDQLASNLNAMLDRIQHLMDGLRQVSADVAHDLRTPLTRLRRRLEALLAEGGGEARVHATQALAQVDEILAIFAALLRIAQVEGGGGREAFRMVDLSSLVGRIGEAYAPVAEDKGKLLRVEIAPGVAVSGDEDLIAQLASNLLENALTHSASTEPVSLSVRAEGRCAVLAVADRGQGIPESERAKVVGRFYRLDRSRTTAGAGLGLALVQAIVQLHGGRLELGDNRPGLLARVTLPRVLAAAGG